MSTLVLEANDAEDQKLLRVHAAIARYRARHGDENATIDHSDAPTVSQATTELLMNPEYAAVRVVALERDVEMLWAAVRNLNYQWGSQL